MCPSAASTSADPAPVATTEGAVPPEFTPVDTHAPSQPEVAAKNGVTPQRNPYAPRASDFLSNVRRREVEHVISSADEDGLFGGEQRG